MTDDELEELVQEWNAQHYHDLTLFEFIQDNLGWTWEQYEFWVVSGEQPN